MPTADGGGTSVTIYHKNMHLLSIEERCIVSKISNVRDVPLKQTNNGVYTFIEHIDENTLNEVYIFLKTKLGQLCFAHFCSNIYNTISQRKGDDQELIQIMLILMKY